MVLPDTRVGGNHFVFVLSVNVHMIFATRICKVGWCLSVGQVVYILHIWQGGGGNRVYRYTRVR